MKIQIHTDVKYTIHEAELKRLLRVPGDGWLENVEWKQGDSGDFELTIKMIRGRHKTRKLL
jgi:hypothetical protein